MTVRLGSLRIVVLVLAWALGGAAGCGGDGGDGGDDGSAEGGSGGGGGDGGGAVAAGADKGLPSRLPADEAECKSAEGADACYFDACCAEFVACSENADCARTFDCYATCPDDDDDCLASCAGSSLVDGAVDFSAALTCAVFASDACADAEPDPDGGPDQNPDVGPLGSFEDELGWNLVVSDDPLTAEVEPDSERAVSREITSDGGTLTATAEDGSVFELTIPEGALYGPTVITLTPLLSVDVELEGATYGVQIEPDGLEMMGSPTLEITPPEGAEWSAEREVPLAINGADSSVSLALLDHESVPLRLALTHFSSYVVLLSEKGIDSTLSQADIRRRFGGDEEARIQSAAAERLGRARQSQLLGLSEDTPLDLGFADLVAEYEEHVLKPRLAKAGDSCAAGKLAIRTLLGVERQLQLLGTGTDSQSRLIELLPTVAEACMREEYEICRDEHIITRVLPTLFGYMRQAQLLGLVMEINGVSISPPWLLQAEDYVRKCLNFELQFDSNVAHADDTAEFSMSESVTARVPVSFQASLTVLPADALPPGAASIGALISGGPDALESSGYSVHTNQECRTIADEHPADGELYVSFLGWTPGENSPKTPGGALTIQDIGLSLALSPNLSSYDWTQQELNNPGCGSQTAAGNETVSWSSTLGSYLLSLFATGENGAWIDDWKPVNGDIIATKDLTLDYTDGSYTSKGPVKFILFHAPL